jgi:heme-degrading monooxygenase HmoA
MIADTLKLPYYAVIFTSVKNEVGQDYYKTAGRMEELAKLEKGFLGIESAQSEIGITVSYWKSLDAILKWKNNVEHSLAREKGKSIWYKNFKVRIGKVERDYEFEK